MADDAAPIDPVSTPARLDRRTFLAAAAFSAAFVAGCSNGRSSSAPSGSAPGTSPSTTGAPTTLPPATTTAPTVVTPTTVGVTSVPAPLPSLPSSDRWWLDGNFGPVVGDLRSTDLTVTGRLPAGLAGTWVRNGPNPTGESPHWFLGNGMVHGLRVADGRAEWYQRRAIATPFADGADGGIPGGAVSYSNVSSVHHAGRLLSLGEIGFPYELDPDDLTTVGPYDFAGRLTTNMTAHPKIDPVTGEMFFFGYGFTEPYLTYLVADAAGTLQRAIPIDIGSPSMVHDFAITERSAVFLDLAVQFAPDDPGLPYRFDRAHACRIGVIDRAATTDTTRWFEIEPCFVFHTINAHQTGSVITLDVVRYDELWATSSTETFPFAVAYRYVVDLESGTVTEGPLDDRPSEFPMVDRRLTGRAHTTGWALSVGGTFSAPTSSSLVRYGADGAVDASSSYDFPGADIGGEPLFVADDERPDEGGGWLLMPVFRADTHTSDLAVFDAQAVGDGPVATVHLPERVPFGFHASWSPAV